MNEAIILTLRSGYGEFGMWRHAIRTEIGRAHV